MAQGGTLHSWRKLPRRFWSGNILVEHHTHRASMGSPVGHDRALNLGLHRQWTHWEPFIVEREREQDQTRRRVLQALTIHRVEKGNGTMNTDKICNGNPVGFRGQRGDRKKKKKKKFRDVKRCVATGDRAITARPPQHDTTGPRTRAFWLVSGFLLQY